MFVYTYTYMYMYIFVCIARHNMYIHMHIHIYTYIFMHILYMYIHIHVCIYIHIYVHVLPDSIIYCHLLVEDFKKESHLAFFTKNYIFISNLVPRILLFSLTGRRFQKTILLSVLYKHFNKFFQIWFRGFYSPGSDLPHKIMRYWFYYPTQLAFNFLPEQYGLVEIFCTS